MFFVLKNNLQVIYIVNLTMSNKFHDRGTTIFLVILLHYVSI